MGSVVVLHVVGFRKRGKTSLIERICEELESLGIEYTIVKQTKHELKEVEKGDTRRFISKGAKRVILVTRDGTEVILRERLDPFLFAKGVVIVEGWRGVSRRDWWAVVVAKDLEEGLRLKKPNTIAILTRDDDFKVWGKVIARRLAVASRLMG